MKRTPLKTGNKSLKRTPLKSNNKGLKVNSSLKRVNFLKNKGTELKKTKSLENKINNLIKKTELKKQNVKSKEKWEQVRNKALERDNHKCIICGKPAKQVHHIHLRSKRKDLLYEINNLVSLCDKCHNHSSTEGLKELNEKIAKSMYLSLDDLLEYASIKSEENDYSEEEHKFSITPRENHYICIKYNDTDNKLEGFFGSEIFGLYWEKFKVDDMMNIIPIVAKISRLKPRKVLLKNTGNNKTKLTDFFEDLLRKELNCEIEISENEIKSRD